MLRWQPEPVVAVAGCRHETITEVTVTSGGRLVWRDDVVCGRFGEPAGDLRADLTLRYAGATLYRHDLAVGPTAQGWSGAAILGRNTRDRARERTASGDGPGDGRATEFWAIARGPAAYARARLSGARKAPLAAVPVES